MTLTEPRRSDGDAYGAAEDALEAGRTLPAGWYTDPAVFARERQLIFMRGWLFAGMVGDIPAAGDYVARNIGPVPALVVRGERGEINAFANVCQHRGARLVPSGCGHQARLRCPYHAWTYDLDGRLHNAPRAKRNARFDPEGIALRRLRLELLGPMMFVCADVDAAPLETVFGGMLEALVERNRRPRMDLRLYARREHEVAANWKVLCENGFECYHCPACHASFSATVDVSADFVFELHEDYTVHGLPGERIRADSTQQRAVLAHLWPNVFPAVKADDLVATLQIVPLDVGRSIYRREYWATDDVDEDTRDGFIELLDHADVEDAEICPQVYAGLASSFFESGPLLLPVTEVGVHHFQRRVHRALAGDCAGP